MEADRANIRSMLGLRFRDAATERHVTDGLRVWVRRQSGSSVTKAVRSASGAYVAQGLSGLRPHERSATTVREGSIPYLVQVADRQERFVPVLLRVLLPTPASAPQGLYPVVETPSDQAADEPIEPMCYLFPAIHRVVPAGQTVVYADLAEASSHDEPEPAAYAVLEVQLDPEETDVNGNNVPVWYGIANAEGRVAVQFPYPPSPLARLASASESNDDGPSNGVNGNGTATEGLPLSARTWPLKVRVRYQPSALTTPSGADRPLLPTLFQQAYGTIQVDGSTSTEEWKKTIGYDTPLVLTSTDESVLRVRE